MTSKISTPTKVGKSRDTTKIVYPLTKALETSMSSLEIPTPKRMAGSMPCGATPQMSKLGKKRTQRCLHHQRDYYIGALLKSLSKLSSRRNKKVRSLTKGQRLEYMVLKV